MSNCLGYVVADLALLKAGAVKLPLNGMLTEDGFEYMLTDSGAETVFVGPTFVETQGSLANTRNPQSGLIDQRHIGRHRRET